MAAYVRSFRSLFGVRTVGTSALDQTFGSVYDRLADRWVGCDWPTDFGTRHLDLRGVTARQAALLARATSGQESDQWQDAARWLTKVEADAEAARQAARAASQEALAGQYGRALEHAQRACELEQAYHRRVVWQPLVDAIRDRGGDVL
jgi:prophage DNA circulation protein